LAIAAAAMQRDSIEALDQPLAIRWPPKIIPAASFAPDI
jgi:hypothetical protein